MGRLAQTLGIANTRVPSPTSTQNMTTLTLHERLAMAIFLLSVLAGCGGGSSTDSGPSTPANSVPTVSNLRYSPPKAMPYPVQGQMSARLTITLTYLDADGVTDLTSLTISAPGAVDVIVPKSSITASGSDVAATIDFSLAQSGTRTLSVKATDSAGHVSNALTDDFEVGYNITRSTRLTGDKVSFTIPSGPPDLPACAKLLPGRYVVTATQYAGASPCIPSGFTATTPVGVASQWTSLLGGNSACGIDSNGQVIKQALDFTSKFGMWSFSDTGTQSNYTISTVSSSLNGNDVIIESQLYCK